MNKVALLAVATVAAFSAYTISRSDTAGLNNSAITPPGNQGSVQTPELEPELSVFPATILQGDPAWIAVNNLLNASEVESITFNNKQVGIFIYNSKPGVLVGIDLRMKPGSYTVTAKLKNGKVLEKNLTVTERKIASAPLGIPEKLGGNTPESEKTLINTLVQEGAIINSIPTANTVLWGGEFRLPIDGPITITDTYGYSRLTGASSISHKGTDFRASIGTPVFAMNSGTIRFTDFLRNYGNTIVIDHGLGLQTIYMHLSEINVETGDEVKRGDLIGKSGDTGYVLGPHLHLSIKIGGISIDPERFMALFGN